MNSTIPSEEQIFDYFMGNLTPDVARDVSAYLAKNPELAREGADFVAIANRYAAIPTATPSSTVLNRVQENARRYAHPKTTSVILENIKALFIGRRLVVALSILAVLGLNYAMSHVQNTSFGDPNVTTVASPQDQNNPNLTDLSATRSGTDTVSTPPGEQNDEASQKFNKGRAAFEAGQYNETQEIFSDLMAEYPSFEKRQEVYTYWIEALKKVGRYDLAEKKQKILEEIESE